MLKIGTSGLLATQRALATTANNITNASTEGYNRQRVNFSTRPPEFLGGSFQGTGVQTSSVSRIYDSFLTGEIRSGLSGEGRLSTFASLAGRVGDIVGSEASGLSGGLQSFVASLEGLANDPSSTPVRQVAISEAESLARRFTTLDSRLDSVAREVDARVAGTVDEINGLARSIGELNERIARAQGASGGAGPNDLLDQRDQLINELSSKIEVNTIDQGDGVINVFVGNGQNLVLGGNVNTLSTGAGAFGAQTQEVFVGNTPVTNQLTGGELGGLLDFKREILEPTQNELGRTAVALSQEFNRLQNEGLDLNGDLGADLFAVGGPEVLGSGSESVDVSIGDPNQLTGNDYRLSFDGTDFTLTNTATGQNVGLSGSGTAADPFSADGLEIVADPADFSDGDRLLIQPTRTAAGEMRTLFSDPALLAAAAPVRESASIDNTGNATISYVGTANPTDPPLLNDVTITFDDPPDTFSVVDNSTNTTLASGEPYTSGEPIEFNGWTVQIDGEPDAGDVFTVEANTNGSGDNRNALRLSGMFDDNLLDDGNTTLFGQVDALVSRVGSATASANTALQAQEGLLAQSQAARESVSGVNLEEEAANLVRFQQAYEANAQVIRVADTVFQTLINAVR
ncbi:flagellar hook-associated protein FlgK [Wenzhouxiangella limi]|uniref:Flagellar hook-associated protein 1 n=1 Tax=Wenzhouxiangella limi TaxID=2707351 RepID=A0A845V0G5_9GAMM|nr:flagellar hook-associated protein FlgK [Wenzhouxiangella limi]NDY97107.1 flagellar hook-associated protein FlgK [Wenzhouxiangella limi]